LFTGKAPLKQAKKVVKKNVYNIKQNTKNKETKNVILKKVFETPTKTKFMVQQVIQKLQSCGFQVKGKHVYKKGATHSRTEKAATINEDKQNVWFFADNNISPFKPELNSFKDILGTEYTYTPYVKTETKKVKELKFTIEQYQNTTKQRNHFSTFLNQHFNKEITTPYNLRGVKSDYLKDGTLFPYINYNNEFITAKIVLYNTLTGKRNKSTSANNFHSYKSILKKLNAPKQSKSFSCFYGEHLLKGNSKPVVIFEAEKTATIYSEYFKDIVFLATGGASSLKNKDWSFLKNRDVFLFPDKDANTWFDIAEKRNWYIDTIIKNKGAAKSDAADYIGTEIGAEIFALLNDIEHQSIEDKINGLNFSVKEKRTENYCSTINKETNLIYYKELYTPELSKETFKGKHFNITNVNFKCYSANFNINGYDYENNRLPNAETFTNRLERCFRVLKELNPDKDITKHFYKVLNNVYNYGNFNFNKDYVLNELVTQWSTGTNDITTYKRTRNWRKNSTSIKTKEFQKLLYNDIKAANTYKLLQRLQPMLNEDIYIKKEDIGLKSRQSNEFIDNLRIAFNEKVLGCKTINIYNGKRLISEYLQANERHEYSLNNTQPFHNFHTIYKDTYIRCKKSGTVNDINITDVQNNTLISRQIIRDFINFKTNTSTLKELKTIAAYYLQKPNELTFKRVTMKKTTRIVPVNELTVKQMLIGLKETERVPVPEVSPDVAFNYPLDLTNSYLNVELEIALLNGNQFLYDWILFNYPETTEIQKVAMRAEPFKYISQLQTIAA
jgi:hypothetical protein